MRNVTMSIPRVFVKLLAMALSPAVHLITWAYKIVAAVLSFGCIGLCIVCLIAISAELFYVGLSREMFEYGILCAASALVRWLVLHSVPLLQLLQETIDDRACAPIRADYYDQYNSYDDYYTYF